MFKQMSGLVITAMTSLTVATPSQAKNSSSTMTYEVPASDLLETSLIIDLDKVKFRLNDQEASLDYKLPKELDGQNPKRFLLTGSFDGQFWNLSTNDSVNSDSHPSAVARCNGTARAFDCVMAYGKTDRGIFPLNTESAEQYLQSRTNLTPEKIAHIKQAQTALSHEPIGIIRVRRN